MQEAINQQELTGSSEILKLSTEDKQNLVGVFAWLIKEDKKQNPAYYEVKKKYND